MSSTDELALFRARVELFALLDELEVYGSVRDEMAAEPERALAIVRGVRKAAGVRNPGALVNVRWRQAAKRPAEPTRLEPELEPEGPPSLDALEQAWALEPSPVGEVILRLMAVAIARHGGFSAMRASFERRRLEPS